MWPFTSKRVQRPPDAIMQLGGPDDWLTLSQCYSNIFISGQVGSGKTTAPGAHLACGLLSHPTQPGALVLCQKPDEADRWKRYCELTNRLDDVIHVQLGGAHSINLLDYTVSGPGGIEEAKAMIGVILEAANRNRARNSSDSYWPESSERGQGYAMILSKMATGKVSFQSILDFWLSLPTSVEQLEDNEWNKHSFAAACLRAAVEKYRDTRAFQMAANWCVAEWPELSDKTRSVIYSVTLNTLDKFLAGKFSDLISTDQTTFAPEMALDDGKIILFDVPGSVHGPAAVWTSVAVKLAFQKAAMRRDLTKPCRPLILWADEAANFCIPELDAMFLSQSRQFKTVCVNIVQNIPLIITALGSSEAARHQAYAWLSNHSTIISAANSDPETCKWHSEMAGETRVQLYGGSTGGRAEYSLFADVMGQELGGANVNWSEQIRPSLPPHAFATLLSKGGREAGFVAEAFVMQSGRVFSNSNPWIKGAWRQIL